VALVIQVLCNHGHYVLENRCHYKYWQGCCRSGLDIHGNSGGCRSRTRNSVRVYKLRSHERNGEVKCRNNDGAREAHEQTNYQSTAFRMVWCGVVWCGVVWCGVVWCGVSSRIVDCLRYTKGITYTPRNSSEITSLNS